MGGMHGLGPIAPDRDEPVFHARWEARVLALTLAVGAWGRWNIDTSRHARERIPGPDYLRMSYYEKWLAALEDLMLTTGLITLDELGSGRPTPGATRDVAAPVTFAVGQRVRARNINPRGHTRLPRYVRGHLGVVERDHGAHVFPDTNAHGSGEQPRRLLGVRFTASELWGEGARAGDSVHLDLWDAYLELP